MQKFNLLLWKNWILIKRHPVAVIFELLFPIAVIALFAWIRNNTATNFSIPTKSEELKINPSNCSFITQIGYAPNRTFYSDLMNRVSSKHFIYDNNIDDENNIDEFLKFNGFKNEEGLNAWIKNQTKSVVGVVFNQPSPGRVINLTYSIHVPEYNSDFDSWYTDQLYYVSPSKKQRYRYLLTPPYYHTCILRLQNEIDQSFIKSSNSKVKAPKLNELKTFPYPAVEYDEYVIMAIYVFPILFVLCMIFSTKTLIKNITIERESRLAESMKMMGLSSTSYWLSWFIRTFLILLISFTINLIFTTTSIISKVPMFDESNPLLIWIFFISYIASMITYCFLVSVIFKKSSRAGIVGSLLFISAVLPFMIYQNEFSSFSYVLKMLFCMLTNTNMSQGIIMIIMAESDGDGVGFSDLFKRHVEFKFSFGELLIFMNLGSSVQILLTFYIEKVFPGNFGVAKPWNFPVKSFLKRLKPDQQSEIPEMNKPLRRPLDYEEEPMHLKVGIEIKNLSKKFKNKFAVKNLTLNLYESQITVLLGHNGAGKTTAMSMLTGLFQPTSGTAIVNGFDITNEIDKARQSLGVCPQHDILFEELTVQEHLEFFCKLKGMNDIEDIQKEVEKYSNLLGISEKLSAESRTLSGGQKRRLSIAIALCGNSKFVIMDEATSGMDPSSRRDLWNLLVTEKKKRTILISTHFMDEADVLGDRIAIMSEGQLQTVGSSFFLKKRFGDSYRLTCVKERGFDSQNILDLLEEHVPEAYVESEGKTETVFVISKDKLPFFEEIFEKLEENLKALKVSSFGCNFTSLEDVFLKLGYGTFDDSKQNSDFRAVVVENPRNFEKDVNSSLACYQIYAMISKKFYVYRRMWKMFLIYGILSALVIFLVTYLLSYELSEPQEIKISLDTYEETETLMKVEKKLPLTKAYANLFHGKDKILEVTKDIEEIILKKSNVSLGTVNSKNLIAATFKKDNKIIGWFNTQPYHTMPLTVNTINRAILKSIMGNSYDITVSIKPFHVSENYTTIEDPVNLMLDIPTYSFILTLWPLIYIGNYIKEREMRFKFLQFICGTNRLVFWVTSFIFDYVMFTLICFVTFGSHVLANHHHSQLFEAFGAIMVIGLSYGFSWITFIYAFSYLFSKPSTGEVMLLFLSIISPIMFGIYKMFEIVAKDNFFINLFYWICLIFAPASLMESLVWYFESSIEIFSKFDDESMTIYDFSKIQQNIIMNFVSGCIFFTIVLLIDYNIFAYIYYKISSFKNPISLTNSEVFDEDVQLESASVNKMSIQDIKGSNLVLRSVTKSFKRLNAVRQLSLNINQHECFGLLGVNGAGKTTTFKMMTGDELITSGDIWIKGNCLKTQLLKAHKFIGYCPQYDNCIPELTGREILKIFALIREIKMNEISELIDEMATELDFKEHLDKQVRTYSGGNKRKLSTALALLGNPELIFLDECTTGVDPQARRQIWNAIMKIRDNNRLSSSIVLTSHSMDECEALCTRIGIMVAGQFKCLGPIQYLKNNFSKGFVLTIKTGLDSESSIENVKREVFKKFVPSVELKESYLDILTFHLNDVNLKYSKVFKNLAEIKEETGIKDYALTQMSLEQVFLNISHHD